MKKSWVYAMSWVFLMIPTWVWGALVDVFLVSEHHRHLPLYPAEASGPGTYRFYAEAVRGLRYAIRVRNNTPHRIGLVIAVDGRNIISGEVSQLGREERMYVLPPYGSALYEGWRTAKDQVNRFYFTDAPDSYAGAWGDYSAMGVIAVAVFREQGSPLMLYEGREKKDGATVKEIPMSRSVPPGTGFGEGCIHPPFAWPLTPSPWRRNGILLNTSGGTPCAEWGSWTVVPIPTVLGTTAGVMSRLPRPHRIILIRADSPMVRG